MPELFVVRLDGQIVESKGSYKAQVVDLAFTVLLNF
jgi:hypothetical protein